MVADFIQHIHAKTNSSTFRVSLPEALQTMEGEDAQFETVASSKIQPAVMERVDHITKRKIAVIFRNDSRIIPEKRGTEIKLKTIPLPLTKKVLEYLADKKGEEASEWEDSYGSEYDDEYVKPKPKPKPAPMVKSSYSQPKPAPPKKKKDDYYDEEYGEEYESEAPQSEEEKEPEPDPFVKQYADDLERVLEK